MFLFFSFAHSLSSNCNSSVGRSRRHATVHRFTGTCVQVLFESFYYEKFSSLCVVDRDYLDAWTHIAVVWFRLVWPVQSETCVGRQRNAWAYVECIFICGFLWDYRLIDAYACRRVSTVTRFHTAVVANDIHINKSMSSVDAPILYLSLSFSLFPRFCEIQRYFYFVAETYGDKCLNCAVNFSDISHHFHSMLVQYARP